MFSPLRNRKIVSKNLRVHTDLKLVVNETGNTYCVQHLISRTPSRSLLGL